MTAFIYLKSITKEEKPTITFAAEMTEEEIDFEDKERVITCKRGEKVKIKFIKKLINEKDSPNPHFDDIQTLIEWTKENHGSLD